MLNRREFFGSLVVSAFGLLTFKETAVLPEKGGSWLNIKQWNIKPRKLEEIGPITVKHWEPMEYRWITNDFERISDTEVIYLRLLRVLRQDSRRVGQNTVKSFALA